MLIFLPEFPFGITLTKKRKILNRELPSGKYI